MKSKFRPKVELHCPREPTLFSTSEFYIDGRRRNGRPRIRPPFPPELWNVRRRTLKGWPRTNNGQEAANRRLGAVVPAAPSIYSCLRALGREELTTSKDIARISEGLTIRRRRRRVYVERDDAFQKIVDQYDDMPRHRFLRKIAKKLCLTI